MILANISQKLSDSAMIHSFHPYRFIYVNKDSQVYIYKYEKTNKTDAELYFILGMNKINS